LQSRTKIFATAGHSAILELLAQPRPDALDRATRQSATASKPVNFRRLVSGLVAGFGLLAITQANAYTPMPVELPIDYPNQDRASRDADDVTEGVKFIGEDYTLAVSSSDNYVVMEVAPELNTLLRRAASNSGTTLQAVQKISTAALSHFDDQFDFVILTHNEAQALPNAAYLGVHYRASNEVSGLGRPLASQAGTFGSAGYLKSVIHLPVSGALRGGPSLHEIMHRWGNSLRAVTGDRRGHWGYTSVDGVLGGFDLQTLQVPAGGAGDYQATGSGSVSSAGEVSANGYPWNNMAYSPLEQYLMGARAPDQVRDIVEIEGVVDSVPDDDTFTGTGRRVISISDIVSADGDRVPSFSAAQNSFRTLYVVVTASPLNDADWSFHDEQIDQFSLAGDDGDDSLFNFWEATQGFASMSFAGLAEIAHDAVPLPTDISDIRVTSFRHRVTRIEVSEENNYWINAIVSQAGAQNIALDGMRFGLVGQNGTGSEFVRCGNNWTPFDFPAGFVIETGLIECAIEEPGTYQTVAQVRVGVDWVDIFSSDSFEVYDLPPATIDDLQVDSITTGAEVEGDGTTFGQRHWVNVRVTNTAARDLTVGAVRAELEPLDGQVVDPVCSSIAGTTVAAGQTFNSGRVYCPELQVTGQFAIGVDVEVEGVWNRLAQSAPFDVAPLPVTEADDIAVDLTFVSDPNSIVAGQADNVQIRARYTNGGRTDAVFDSMQIQISSADGTTEASCYSTNDTVTVKPEQFFSTGTVSCPTLNNVGTFELTTRFLVNSGVGFVRGDTPIVVKEPETNLVDDVVIDNVELSGTSVQMSTVNNFFASASVKNVGSRSIRTESIRFRILDLDENSSTSEIVCFESNQARTIAAAGEIDTGRQACTLSRIGSYQFVIDLKIDGEWYEKYRSSTVSVVAVEPLCRPPDRVYSVNSSKTIPRLFTVSVSNPRPDGERTDAVISLSGRDIARANPNLKSVSDYWVGIKAVRTSDDSKVQFEPIRAAGNIGRDGVSESMVIPPDGVAAWIFSYCNGSFVDIDLDFTTRAVNLNLAELLLETLSGAGRIRHDKVILFSSQLSEIPSFAAINVLVRLAILDVRADRSSVAARRIRAAANKLGVLFRNSPDRLALYQAFRSIGLRLGRRAAGETIFQAYTRELETASRTGKLQAALNSQFDNLERLLTEAVALSGDSARRMTVRTIGQ